MKKLKLELETLRVQSFDTSSEVKAERGTVRGNAIGELTQADEQIEVTETVWWRCFTLTCICGASENFLCSLGCPG